MRTFRHIIVILAATCMLTTIRAQQPQPPPPPPAPPAGVVPSVAAVAAEVEDPLAFLPVIVAKHGDFEVTAAQVRQVLGGQLMQLAQAGAAPPKKQVRERVESLAKFLIDRHILMGFCARDKVEPDLEAAAKQLKQFEDRAKQQGGRGVPVNLEGEERTKAIARLADDMAIQKWIETVLLPTVEITDDELTAFYAEHKDQFVMPERMKASHILIKVSPGTSQKDRKAKRQGLEAVRKELKNGVAFAEMAKKHSECPSAPKGGDLGFFRRGQMVPSFEKAAFALKPGELSDIVETRFGYHLILGGERKQPEQKSLEEVKEALRTNLRRNALGEELEKHLAEVRGQSEIEILLPKE